MLPDILEDIQEEYRILRDLSDHPNLPDFYGAYLKRGRGGDEIWFVMQVRKPLKHYPKPKGEYLKLLVVVLYKAFFQANFHNTGCLKNN